MVTKKFHLVGGEDWSSRIVDIGEPKKLADIRDGIAAEFAIVDPKGINFQDANSKDLQAVEHLVNSEGSVGITVDGRGIRHPSNPPPLPVVGNFYEIYPDHLGNHARLFAKYGSVIKTTNLGRTTYLTDNPDVARFAFNETEYFTKKPSDPNHPLYGIRDESALFLCDTDAPAFQVAHKFIPPSMSPKAVRHYTPVLHTTVREAFKVFDELDDKGDIFNVYHYMTKMAGQVICKLVLGLDCHHFDSLDSKIHEIIAVLGKYLKLNKKVQSRGTWYSYLPFGDPRELLLTRQKLYSKMSEAIETAPRGGTEDLPIATAALNASCIVDYLVRALDEKGNKLPPEYVLSNTIALVGAGYVTSASFLSWLIYALVAYPGHQDRLVQELVDAGVDGETEWTYDMIHSLPYLDKFIKETQRVHSPSFLSARNSKQEVILPGGYVLPKDSVIIPTIPHLHHNPDHWSDPAKFWPDRWDTELVKNRHRSLYVPFAAGARGCVGYNVALQEVKVVLVNLIYRYHFENATDEPVDYDPEFLVIRPLNFYARATRRTEWPQRTSNACKHGNGV